MNKLINRWISRTRSTVTSRNHSTLSEPTSQTLETLVKKKKKENGIFPNDLRVRLTRTQIRSESVACSSVRTTSRYLCPRYDRAVCRDFGGKNDEKNF